MARRPGGMDEMNERQRRSDAGTAKAVARGINILAVRNRALARNYMEFKHVPDEVIARVLDRPDLRRAPSVEQLVTEAITPSDTSHIPAQRSDTGD